jgi:hypothetical protein
MRRSFRSWSVTGLVRENMIADKRKERLPVSPGDGNAAGNHPNRCFFR